MDLYQKNYTVVGLGMEGGSYALAIKKYIGARVYGIDIDSKTCVKAQHAGIITNKPIEDILKDTDVLILALYPRECIRFLEKYQQMLRPRTLITDVCGVKAFLLEKIPQLLREDLVYVAGHPMAGNQYRGFDNADIRIFEDKNYILVPHEKNTPEDIAFVEALAKAIGCREVTKVDLYTHEKKIAYASHMMHFISVCVTNSPTYDESLDFFAGGSFRDLTRISDINPYLWSETFLLNKEYLLEELKLYKNNIEYLENALIMNDEERIVEFLEKSRRKKSGER